MAETQIKTARWVKIVLAISLTLNLIVIGLAGGAAIKGRELRDARPDPNSMSIVTRALPLRYQANVRREIRDRFDVVRASRETMQALRQELAMALTADPFDIELVEDIFSRQHTIMMGLAGAGQDIVIEQIETMDADDRARYAENLLRDYSPRPPRDR